MARDGDNTTPTGSIVSARPHNPSPLSPRALPEPPRKCSVFLAGRRAGQVLASFFRPAHGPDMFSCQFSRRPAGRACFCSLFEPGRRAGLVLAPFLSPARGPATLGLHFRARPAGRLGKGSVFQVVPADAPLRSVDSPRFSPPPRFFRPFSLRPVHPPLFACPSPRAATSLAPCAVTGRLAESRSPSVAGDGPRPELRWPSVAGDGHRPELRWPSVACDGPRPELRWPSVACDGPRPELRWPSVACDGPRPDLRWPPIARDEPRPERRRPSVAGAGIRLNHWLSDFCSNRLTPAKHRKDP